MYCKKIQFKESYLILSYVRMNGQSLHIRSKQVSIAVTLVTYIQEVLSQISTGTVAIATGFSAFSSVPHANVWIVPQLGHDCLSLNLKFNNVV
jgi:hypothetical protein